MRTSHCVLSLNTGNYAPKGITGDCYSGPLAAQLTHVAKRKGYTSPIWLTEHGARSVCMSIPSKEKGVTITGHGKPFELFNLTQAVDVWNPTAKDRLRKAAQNGVVGIGGSGEKPRPALITPSIPTSAPPPLSLGTISTLSLSPTNADGSSGSRGGGEEEAGVDEDDVFFSQELDHRLLDNTLLSPHLTELCNLVHAAMMRSAPPTNAFQPTPSHPSYGKHSGESDNNSTSSSLYSATDAAGRRQQRDALSACYKYWGTLKAFTERGLKLKADAKPLIDGRLYCVGQCEKPFEALRILRQTLAMRFKAVDGEPLRDPFPSIAKEKLNALKARANLVAKALPPSEHTNKTKLSRMLSFIINQHPQYWGTEASFSAFGTALRRDRVLLATLALLDGIGRVPVTSPAQLLSIYNRALSGTGHALTLESLQHLIAVPVATSDGAGGGESVDVNNGGGPSIFAPTASSSSSCQASSSSSSSASSPPLLYFPSTFAMHPSRFNPSTCSRMLSPIYPTSNVIVSPRNRAVDDAAIQMDRFLSKQQLKLVLPQQTSSPFSPLNRAVLTAYRCEHRLFRSRAWVEESDAKAMAVEECGHRPATHISSEAGRVAPCTLEIDGDEEGSGGPKKRTLRLFNVEQLLGYDQVPHFEAKYFASYGLNEKARWRPKFS